MIYLDNGATSFHKPPGVIRGMERALRTCANPGRGGYAAAMEAARTVFRCREAASEIFDCQPEQVVFTMNCTHGLNIAIGTLVKPGGRVLISGFEHNAVTRPLHHLGAKVTVAGRKLFDWADTLQRFEDGLKGGVDAAVFTHVSNVFGYILPVEQMAAMCRERGVPFIIDAAQSAGSIPVSLKKLGADFIAMPGHKGLLGPQGTGILLCNGDCSPVLFGGTGSESVNQAMPEYLPDRLEAGTVNVPGIGGLGEGLRYLRKTGIVRIGERERRQAAQCAKLLKNLNIRVFAGEHQAGTVSFLPDMDCEEMARLLGELGIAVRAGLHCAPLAHESAGTLQSGTVRVSFGIDAKSDQTEALVRAVSKVQRGKN